MHVVRQQLLLACLARDVGDSLREPEQVHRLGVLQHRHDEPLPLRELDRDAEVDEVARDDRVAAQLAVHVRMIHEGPNGRARDECEVGGVDAVRGLVLLLELLARRDDPRHVDLDRARDVRGGVERPPHVLSDAATHRGHGLERLAG